MSFLKDVLVGTIGRLLQVGFVLLGVILVVWGLFGGGVLMIVGGVVSFCVAYGIRYAMGQIIRHRDFL